MTLPHHPAGSELYAPEVLLGTSHAIARLRLQIARLGPHVRIALLTGEPGTGKHTIARELHRASPAHHLPFLTIPAAELAPQPAPATLYVPGLHTLSPTLQPALLGTLRGLHRETRVIFSSDSDLRGLVATGRLRPELAAAAGTLELRVPALRDRPEDLAAITQSMLARLAPQTSVTPPALEHLRTLDIPGNLAELFALAQRLAPLHRPITPADIPRGAAPGSRAATRLDEVIQRHVLDVLEHCAGNKLRAAELLGISRSTLYRMLETLLT